MPDGAFDACEIVTTSQAGALLGQAAELSKRTFLPYPGGGWSECLYATAGSKALGVDIHVSPATLSSPEQLAEVRRMYARPGRPAQDVPGLADVAIWGGAQLHVFRGQHLKIIVTVMGLDEPAALAAATAAARDVPSEL